MEARFHARVAECGSEEDLYKYLLECVPIIREYTDEAEAKPQVRAQKVMGFEITMKKGIQRKDIYSKYLTEIEGEYNVHSKRVDDEHLKPCINCSKMFTKIFDECTSEEMCTECGATEYILGNEVGFKEEQEIEKTIVYSYKRENHFNEWISQFQAKESTSVPDEVLNQLRFEFKKQKIKDLSEITHEKVKGLLKKLDKSKYYEHVPYIATILNGIQPPTMPQALEDKLRLMFHKIQAPFEKHKPSNRKNFLSYSYVLYKFCELLGEDDYLPCFPLLKSKEKLYIQDVIWKKICEELQWEYIKTI
jgi:hypothetical protein